LLVKSAQQKSLNIIQRCSYPSEKASAERNPMYCPRCGQQQVSDDAGFCTRCGFQLALVKELLVTSGAPPANSLGFQLNLRSGRKGVRRGTKLIFFSIILLPLFFGLSFLFDSPGPLVPPAILFLAGLASILYSSIFGEELPGSKQTSSSTLSENVVDYRTLTPSSLPLRPELNDLRVDTAEIISPPSVTEHTTNLLRKTEAQMDDR